MDYAPAKAELVVSEPGEVFAVLDRHDEEQILAEMQRRVLDVTLYDFPGEGGKLIVDLSYNGVRECIHLMNRTGKVKIRVVPGSLEVEEIQEDGEAFYVATVWAEDLVTGAGFSGTAVQEKRIQLKPATARKWKEAGKQVPDDRMVWDRFARTKAVNKAERNALAKFIPERVRQTLIAQYVGQPERIKRIEAGAGAESLAELPPPLTDERAEAQKRRCRQLYDEIRELVPGGVGVLLPAQFHAYLTRAEHSHERLAEFIEYLEQRVEDARRLAAQGGGEA